jgi:hypothetical protein
VAGIYLLTEDSIGQMESDHTSTLTQNFRSPMVPNVWFYGLGLWCENPIERRCMLVNSAEAFGTFPWIDRTSGTHGVLITLESFAMLKYHSVTDAATVLGSALVIKETFVGFHKYLYQ